ncbi:hypothetical protein M011DRAFT_166019 [Sporormia fimetaria CBS 119925]|uniref:BTB domain-containing protein n=1 Tax=Sporormia fimetaria CBS 119925 TaxID=1340428 RepID=A0A6A6V4K7_9PLEO|nr:hypothetical protein M011DRAFT_166019 [Sporormia fimetaria CBS 119925]
MPEVQEKQLHELLSRSMVDIYVGPNNTHWVLHEKLLCYHSPFFRKIFLSKSNTTHTYGLPEEEDATFRCLVGWLYSSTLPVPREEADLSVLFDLYLLSEKLSIPALSHDILQTVREWYKYSDSFPGLRRVQYIYANTEEGSAMRVFMVHSIARMMVLGKEMPLHWDKALKKNGQLAVDLIKAEQDEEEEEEEEEEGEHDSGEDTVVESPIEAKNPKLQKKGNEQKTDKMGDMVNGMGKMGLDAVPNQVSLDDYGTLH